MPTTTAAQDGDEPVEAPRTPSESLAVALADANADAAPLPRRRGGPDGKPITAKWLAAEFELEQKPAFFCLYYLDLLNATEAAKRAGYSKKTARQQGSRLLSNANVARCVDWLKDTRAVSLLSNAERVAIELERLAYFNPKSLLRPDGKLKTPAELTDDEAAALSSIEWEEETRISKLGKTGRTKTTRIKYKWHDKRGALDSLRRHLGMDRDDVGGDDGPVVKVYIGWDPSKREE